MKVSPTHGGCWYCQRIDGNDWLISKEFDCYLHLHCLQKELVSIPSDCDKGEAGIFESEFRELLERET